VIPGWLWVLAMTSICAFLALVGYMENYQNKNPPVVSDVPSSRQQAAANTATKPAMDKPKATTFDFYSLLPELEKIIPDREVEQKPAQTTQPSSSVATKPSSTAAPSKPLSRPQSSTSTSVRDREPSSNAGSRYYLQAGSFKDFQAADSRRASLALIGIESTIQKANIPNRGLWHRVRLGPFSSMNEMRRTRKRLKNNNIVSIMLTVKR